MQPEHGVPIERIADWLWRNRGKPLKRCKDRPHGRTHAVFCKHAAREPGRWPKTPDVERWRCQFDHPAKDSTGCEEMQGAR